MAGCDDFCILDFGAKFDGTSDDTAPWALALDEVDKQGGGRLRLPAGTSITSQPLFPQRRTIVEGKGPEATILLNASSDIFSIGRPPEPPGQAQSFHHISFRDMTIVSQLNNGGHIFVLEGLAYFCSWSHLWLKQFNAVKQIFRYSSPAEPGGFFDCLWEHSYLQHAQFSTVPAFEISASDQRFNANTLRNLRCEHSHFAPFFKFTCSGMARNNGCVMSQINFEKCFGGMVHWYSAGNWTCEGLVQYDVTQATTGHGLLLAQAPGGGATRHMTLIGCDRRSGTLGTSYYDVWLEPFQATQIVLINYGENASVVGYKVNANNNQLTWIGMVDPDPTTTQLVNLTKSVRIGGDGEVRAPMIVQDP